MAKDDRGLVGVVGTDVEYAQYVEEALGTWMDVTSSSTL